MRFLCPRCEFDEKDDAGVTPVSVRCPGCGASFHPVSGRWEPLGLAPAPRRTVRVRAVPTFGLAWMSRPARA